MPAKIRKAHINEVDQLSELALKSKSFWPYEKQFIEDCKEDLKLDPRHVKNDMAYVYEIDGRILGYYAFSKEESVPEMIALFVEPDWIGRGIGYLLWEHSKTKAREFGWTFFDIVADPFAAEKFYLKMGCKVSGEIKSPVKEERILPLLRYEII